MITLPTLAIHVTDSDGRYLRKINEDGTIGVQVWFGGNNTTGNIYVLEYPDYHSFKRYLAITNNYETAAIAILPECMVNL